jgi:uncharacterized protein (TIRG00374 family)
MNRTSAIRFVRLILAVVLLSFFVSRLPGGALVDAFARSVDAPGWLTAGIAFTFLGLLMGAVRWHIVLEAQGLRVRGTDVFRIFFIGQFFNAFMPGACGGDMARAYYAAHVASGKKTEAISTVFVDRAVGLFATIVVGCLVVLVRLPFFLRQSETKLAGVLMLAFLLGSVVGMLVLFRRHRFEHWPLFRRIEQASAVGMLIRRAYDAFYLYRSRHGVMVKALALSILNLVFLTLACLTFGVALDLPLARPMVQHFTFFPIITTLAAVPITPGALGLREGLFVTLYGAIGAGAAQALTLSLMVYAGGLAWSLLGGVFFVARSAAEHHGIRQELHEVRSEG